MHQAKRPMRLHYFLKTGIQLRFLRVNILLAIFVTLAVAFSVYQLSMNILGSSLEEVYPPGLLQGIYGNLNTAFGARLLLIILVVIIATFLIFHRIAGPAYHIERNLSTMANGDLTKKIYLRKHDELKPIASNLNKMVDFISQNLDTIQKNLETMEKLNEGIKSEKLGASLKGIRDALSKFKIK